MIRLVASAVGSIAADKAPVTHLVWILPFLAYLRLVAFLGRGVLLQRPFGAYAVKPGRQRFAAMHLPDGSSLPLFLSRLLAQTSSSLLQSPPSRLASGSSFSSLTEIFLCTQLEVAAQSKAAEAKAERVSAEESLFDTVDVTVTTAAP